MLSLQTIFDIYSSASPEEEIWKQFEDPCIKEAIYLASPNLFDQLERENKSGENKTKGHQRLTTALLKYITRMCSRPTPFGLFAGSSVGSFSDSTDIVIGKRSDHVRHTRLDFEVLAKLSRNITSSTKVLNEVLLYPNTTIYKSADQLRYIKVKSIDGTKQYVLQRIEPNEFIGSTLRFTEKGKTFIELVDHIVKFDFKFSEAKEFIENLVAAQILVDSFEPYTIGQDFHEYLLSSIPENANSPIGSLLTDSKKDIIALDKIIGNNIRIYEKSIKSFRKRIPSVKREHLFQVDLYPTYRKKTLNSNLKIEISKTLNLLSRLFTPYENREMKDFIKAYQTRYETQTLPLVQVLDLDYGIGYPVDKNKPVYTYMNDLSIGTGTKEESGTITLNRTEIFLAQLIQSSKDSIIDLAHADIGKFKLKDPNLNATFFSMAELLVDEGETNIFLEGFIGSTATNILGRYTNGCNEIKHLVEEIIGLEEEHHKDSIVAEIAHLPEDRTGNVLFHPQMRDFKINFLSGINRDDLGDISIDDLLVEVTDSKVLLKSKKFNKPIVPYLSNAHNYTRSNLPIYNFLCDYQFHHYSGKIGFHWGKVSQLYDYLPRITYNKVILSKAQWTLQVSFINSILTRQETDYQLIKSSKDLQRQKNIPRYVQIKQEDNLLLIDFDNPLSVRMFLSVLPKDSDEFITLLEFYYTKDSLIKDNSNLGFSNEFIFCMKNTKGKYEN